MKKIIIGTVLGMSLLFAEGGFLSPGASIDILNDYFLKKHHDTSKVNFKIVSSVVYTPDNGLDRQKIAEDTIDVIYKKIGDTFNVYEEEYIIKKIEKDNKKRVQIYKLEYSENVK